MEQFKIVSDTACDLGLEFAVANKVNLVPFGVSFENDEYLLDAIDITPEDLFKKLSTRGVYGKTSLPSVQDYIDVFEAHLKNNDHIICITLSSNFSGSYQSAYNAAEILKETYTNAIIEIIDSQSATGTQGMLVREAIALRDNGVFIEEASEKIRKLAKNMDVYFTVADLAHLAHGGRISNASSLIGGIVDIKPILRLSSGVIAPIGKVRGRKKSIELVKASTKKITDKASSFDLIVMSSIFNEEFEQLYKEVQEAYPGVKVYTSFVGSTVAVHVGPTALGIGIMVRD